MVERRFSNSPAQIKTRTDGTKSITGYGAVFYREGEPGTQYVLWDGAVERLSPRVFDRPLSERDDVRVLVNHEPDNLLGRTGSKTAELTQDSVGLIYDVPLDVADPDHVRFARKIERGDLDGSSFSFTIPAGGVHWEMREDGPDIRWLDDVVLYDVGPVTFPAYGATTAGTRSAGDNTDIRAEYDTWKSSLEPQPTPKLDECSKRMEDFS
jgi:hypothetical protein